MSSVAASFQQVHRRQYISTAPFYNNFFSYSTRMDNKLITRGSLVVHTAANPTTCAIGHILRENGKKLQFGTHPDLNDPNNTGVSYTYLIGVYDAQTFLSGFIEPNCPLFAPFNTDKSYQNELVNEAVDASTGLTDEGPPVYTRGNITTTNGNILATIGNVTAGVNVVAGSNVTATGGNVSATVGDVTAGRNIVAASNITATAGTVSSTKFIVSAVGNGVGSPGSPLNASAGTAALMNGVANVYTTKLTSSSLVFVTINNGTAMGSTVVPNPGANPPYFTVYSTIGAGNNSTFYWMMIN